MRLPEYGKKTVTKTSQVAAKHRKLMTVTMDKRYNNKPNP